MDAEAARAIVDANSYMTLATAAADGAPWASPVWFAHQQYETLLWMSRPDARHSRNIAARREIAIVIFDSTVAPHERNAVYVEATAALVPDAELADAVAAYAARSVARGLETLARESVSGNAPWRLYRARAHAVYVLEDEHDRRVAVQLAR
jgi:nitroimidazol reductase NimA-like FMN-containing flavoprotein (pyridoxamine 5'-phosphate oxidase superfamily)